MGVKGVRGVAVSGVTRVNFLGLSFIIIFSGVFSGGVGGGVPATVTATVGGGVGGGVGVVS